MLSGKLNIFMQNTETTDLSAFTCGPKLSGDDVEAMRPWCSLFIALCFFFLMITLILQISVVVLIYLFHMSCIIT